MSILRTRLDQYDKDNKQAGIITPTAHHCYPAASAALTASRAYVGRFVPSRDMTIISINFAVSVAAGADDACDVGIYSADLATKLVSSGATTGKLNSTGAKSIAVTPTLLRAGTVYYSAFSVGTFGGTAATLLMAEFADGNATGFFGLTAGVIDAAFKASSHPLPSSLAAFTTGTARSVLLALRES